MTLEIPIGANELLNSQPSSPEAARATIAERIADREFGKRLLEKDPAASKEWSDLHKAGYPAAPAPTSPQEVNSQHAGRNEQAWNDHISALRQRFPLTDAQVQEIRGGMINAEAYQFALDEKNRMVRDKGFYRKLLDGDREAARQWGAVTLALGLRPVKDFRFTPK